MEHSDYILIEKLYGNLNNFILLPLHLFDIDILDCMKRMLE